MTKKSIKVDKFISDIEKRVESASHELSDAMELDKLRCGWLFDMIEPSALKTSDALDRTIMDSLRRVQSDLTYLRNRIEAGL